MENKGIRKTVRGIARFIVRVFYRAKYHGIEYPESGPYIICPNHTSIVDIAFVAVHEKKRWVFFMAKSELYKTKLMAWFLNKMGAFPIRRGQSDVRSIKRSVMLIQDNELVCIFPQGTRSRNGTRLPARRGVAMLAALTGAKVIPVYIEKRKKFYHKTDIYVGQPVDTKLNRDSSKEEIAQMSEYLMDILYELPEVYKD